MTMTFREFEIKGIWRIRSGPEVYRADVIFSFDCSIDGKNFGSDVSVHVNVRHSRGGSVKSLEQKIFEAAQDVLNLAIQTSHAENAEISACAE